MTPTREQVGWVGLVFGPRGVRMLSRVELCEADDACQAYTLYAGASYPGRVQMVLSPDLWEEPLEFVHEFAHVFHSLEFPHLTENVPTHRAEACALIAEMQFVALYWYGEADHPKWLSRSRAWEAAASRDPVLAHALRAVEKSRRPLTGVSLRDGFERILWGEFDDDGGQGWLRGAA